MLHVLENKISLREWSEALRSCTSEREPWLALFEFWLCSHISMFLCFIWELGNICHQRKLSKKQEQLFSKKKISKFNSKIGNQLFNKFNIRFLFCFYFGPKSQKNEKDRLNIIFENL